jgi:hypothetical protein
VVIRIVVLLVLGLAMVARADSPKLAEGRKAIDEVRYDDAQRLLVAALEEGDNSPAAMREIYRLSASTAVVMGQSEVGEQYYRRWLALDPSATLSSDVAPKLREPFDAARAYIAAHGGLEISGSRTSPTELQIEIVSDPLAMVRAARLGPAGQPAAFGAQRRMRLAVAAETAHIAIVDHYGNTLLELEVAPGTGPLVEPRRETMPSPKPKQSRTWLAFGVPAAILIAGGLGVGTYAYLQWQVANENSADSSQHFFTDVDADVSQSRTLGYVAGGVAAVGVSLAIPAAILFLRSTESRTQVTPLAGGGTTGLAVTTRF